LPVQLTHHTSQPQLVWKKNKIKHRAMVDSFGVNSQRN